MRFMLVHLSEMEPVVAFQLHTEIPLSKVIRIAPNSKFFIHRAVIGTCCSALFFVTRLSQVCNTSVTIVVELCSVKVIKCLFKIN